MAALWLPPLVGVISGRERTSKPRIQAGLLALFIGGTVAAIVPRRVIGLARSGKASTMALSFYFVHQGFTSAKYDDAIAQLEAAGAGAPAGRTFHAALETDGGISVFDIWESQEQFEAFGVTLMPILAALGVELNEPMVAPVYNVIEG